MTPTHFISPGVRRLCCLTVLALTAWRARAQWGYQYDPDWTRNFHAGVLVGFNIKADFSLKGSFGVTGGGAGVYDDGYVKPDKGGALTSDWGYNDGSQYNPANQTLTMHKSTLFTPDTTASGNASGSDSPYLGLDVGYGGVLWRSGQFRVGWELGFGLLPIKITDNHDIAGSITRSNYTFVASGFPMLPPGYRGNPDAPGAAVISSSPTGPPTKDTVQDVHVTGTRTLDVTLYAFKLGPTLFWDVTPHIGLAVGAGPALGLVSGNLKFDETISVGGGTAQNKGQISATDMTYGWYVNTMLTYHTVKNGDFYIGAQYMPMGNVRLSGSNREASLNLRGQMFLSAGINWPF